VAHFLPARTLRLPPLVGTIVPMRDDYAISPDADVISIWLRRFQQHCTLSEFRLPSSLDAFTSRHENIYFHQPLRPQPAFYFIYSIYLFTRCWNSRRHFARVVILVTLFAEFTYFTAIADIDFDRALF